jgi:hypothetical protein
LEILDSDKTKYAKVVADRLCKLEPEALPSKEPDPPTPIKLTPKINGAFLKYLSKSKGSA